MADLRFENVVKRYGDVLAVDNITMEIRDKDFIVLVGPSGCGKSTTLRMIAGLEDITEGSIYIGETLVNDIAPKDRDIAMVFQNYALYPHMTVYENMAFGLKNKKYSKSEIEERIREAAAILDLEGLYKRKPRELSGGQRQRVAIGRAIVRHPEVFLMDEPLSNLDAKLRVRMRAEIGNLHKKLQTTFIYVTHDQLEAMTLGDRIVVMDKGVIQQIGSPEEIYGCPENLFVAGFIGSPSMNFLRGQLEGDGGRMSFVTDEFSLPVPAEREAALIQGNYAGREVVCGIRPEFITDSELPDAATVGRIPFVVDLLENIGKENYVYFRMGGAPAIALLDKCRPYDVGHTGFFSVDMKDAHFFDTETQQRIR